MKRLATNQCISGNTRPGRVSHACHPNTPEDTAEHHELEDSLARMEPCPNNKNKNRGWRDSSTIKRTDYSSRGPGFNTHMVAHNHLLTPVPGSQFPLLAYVGIRDRHTRRQNTSTHKITKIIKIIMNKNKKIHHARHTHDGIGF